MIRSALLRLALALPALLATSCLGGPPPEVAGGEVRNLDRAPVHDVEALHHPTGTRAGTNTILPGQSFALGFPTRELRAESATIRWRTAAGASFSQEVALPACPPELLGSPAWIVYTIHADGHVSVAYEAR